MRKRLHEKNQRSFLASQGGRCKWSLKSVQFVHGWYVTPRAHVQVRVLRILSRLVWCSTTGCECMWYVNAGECWVCYRVVRVPLAEAIF